MAHKHKRRRDDGNGKSSQHNLPPTTLAKPLPTRTVAGPGSKNGKKKESDNAIKQKKKSKGSSNKDDTPRAFARMMQQFETGKPRPKNLGLDDGTNQTRKRKRGDQEGAGEPSKTQTDTTGNNTAPKVPTILPGERLGDFAARVDMALPLSGVSRKSGMNTTDPKLREERQTKHERRLKRMQSEWREEDKKIKEREEAARDENEAQNEEVNDTWKAWEIEAGKKKKKTKASKKKRKKKGSGDEATDDEDGSDDDDEVDPWARLNMKKRASVSNNPFDVVQAPPEKLTKVRAKFKDGAMVDVADVPTAAGSLRRREELATQRQSIVDEYRKLMAGKRSQQ